MSEVMEFFTREDFRNWLQENCMSMDGIWVLFGKADGKKRLRQAKRWKKPSFWLDRWPDTEC